MKETLFSQKSQLVIVGGGEAFDSHEEYLLWLKQCNWNVMQSFPDWKKWLTDGLADTYSTIRVSMPSKTNAFYAAWKIWFEKYFPYLVSSKIVFIGHSLGGIFLAKYLSENTLPFPLHSLHLVAPVFHNEGLIGESTGDFSFDPSLLSHLSSQVQHIHLWASTDDSVVPYEHSVLYKKYLPTAHFHSFSDKGHFSQSHFVELFMELL